MKIQILSDTHNESAREPFVPARTDAEVVVLAGDIGGRENSFRWAAEHFPGKRVVMVAGNHEAWGSEWHTMLGEMRSLATRYGINFLQNDSVIIDGVKFIGATLFTDLQLFGPAAYARAISEARHRMPDYKRILLPTNSRLLNAFGICRLIHPEDTVRLHGESRAYIEARLNEAFAGPVVVVTHHAPSTQSVEERFADDALSPCFASNLDAMIHASQIALWVHGHTHCSFDYQINRTRVVCNAVGYRDQCGGKSPEEISGFRPRLVVEV